MSKSDFKVTFWGTQGSISASSRRKTRYGCNTPCISVECGGHVLVFDMGTGIISFSDYFLGAYALPQPVHLFISHYHLDHIEGLPFAGLPYTPGVNLHIYGQASGGRSPSQLIHGLFSPPYFPLPFVESSPSGRMEFHTVTPRQAITLGDGAIVVDNLPVSHPGGSLSFKVSFGGKSFCYLSDFEYDGHMSPQLLAYLKGCDLTAFDAYFSNDNLIPGWGHSTWEQGVDIWRAAGLKQLAMYHHKVGCSDEELDAIQARLEAISPHLFIAQDGMERII